MSSNHPRNATSTGSSNTKNTNDIQTTTPQTAAPAVGTALELLSPDTLVVTGYSIMVPAWNTLGFPTATTDTEGSAQPKQQQQQQQQQQKPTSDVQYENGGDNSTTSIGGENALITGPIPFLVQHTIETGDIFQLQHRITAIFVARCAAIVSERNGSSSSSSSTGQGGENIVFTDYSTKTICQTIVNNGGIYPLPLRKDNYKVIHQLSEFIRRMIMGYKDVPYHNRKHAYHVVLSTTKLIDMMILSGSRTYGIKYDPIALFALIFAALIHDVEHQGIPNRQLAIEDDRLAVLYNDQSMAENWSLYVAFSEFLQDEFVDLRNCLFNQDGTADDGSVAHLLEQVEYRRFRKLVINLVLSTDLASPERTQIGKSKWKEAFGDPYETLERKLREVAQAHQTPMATAATGNGIANGGQRQRRASITGSRIVISSVAGRRGSAISAISTSPHSINARHGGGVGTVNGNDDEYDQKSCDDSLSVTPEPSETSDNDDDDDDDDDRHHHNRTVAPKFLADVVTATTETDLAIRDKFERRMSAASVQSSKYRQRLGILRTVDLSGETIETYSRRGSVATAKSNASAASASASTLGGGNGTVAMDYQTKLIADEPEELKATVVMETIITAADVAHNLQSWNHMVKWSGRLYMELRRAHVAKRGFDPQEKWFENQIGFLESYLLPVARRLEDTGVFGSTVGQMFTLTVEANRDRWLVQGQEETQKIIAAGNRRYPSKN